MRRRIRNIICSHEKVKENPADVTSISGGGERLHFLSCLLWKAALTEWRLAKVPLTGAQEPIVQQETEYLFYLICIHLIVFYFICLL